MNQEGWGLKDVILFLVIILLAIVIAMFIYNRTFNNLFAGIDNKAPKETYSDIEQNIAHNARTYTDNYYSKALENGDSGVVTVRAMQQVRLLQSVKDIKTKKNCSGYVLFAKTNGVTNYEPYLKCSNYQTKGYKSSLDENVKK